MCSMAGKCEHSGPSVWTTENSFDVIFWAHIGTATHYGHRGVQNVYTTHRVVITGNLYFR